MPQLTATRSPEAPAQQVQGTLLEPRYSVSNDGSTLQGTFHWRTDDEKSTFLHLTLRKDAEGSPLRAQTNFDSSEIKGQGPALWAFMGDRLQQLSDASGVPIVHEVLPNEFSLHLPANDPNYVLNDDGGFQAVFQPHTDTEASLNFQ